MITLYDIICIEYCVNNNKWVSFKCIHTKHVLFTFEIDVLFTFEIDVGCDIIGPTVRVHWSLPKLSVARRGKF